MKLIKLIPFLAIIITSKNAHAQKDTANEIKVFDSGTGNVPKRVQQLVKVKDIIKINPLLFLSGDIPVYYEKVINKSFSFEVAPGITYRDFWGDIFYDLDQQGVYSPSNNSYLAPLPYDSGTTSRLGFSFKIDMRYYFGKKNVMNGFYLSPELGFRNYNINYLNYNNSGEPISTYSKGHTNVIEIKALIGYEEESFKIDNYFADFYLGIGLRSVAGVQVVPENSSNGYYNSTNTISNLNLTFYLGVKLGIGLRKKRTNFFK